MIIPRTDTPGAKDVFVAKRIDESFFNDYEKEEQKMFQEGSIKF